MSYRNRAKYKSLQRYIYKALEVIKFKTGHVSNGWKVVLFGMGIILFSFLFSWVDSTTWEISWGGFSRISGKPGIIISIILLLTTFSLFSIQKKSKLQLVSNWYFKEYTSCIIAGLFVVILCANTLSYISWLQMFESVIISGRWPIFCLSWGIMMTIGGVMMKLEASWHTKWTFINDPWKNNKNEQHEEDTKNNMKLPF